MTCRGLTYNGWLYMMPRHVLDSFIDKRYLRPCGNHRDRLMMSRKLLDLAEGLHDFVTTAPIMKEANDD